MNTQKVILLNGFAGIGKSTVANIYLKHHPLALKIEGDELIVNIGEWTTHEDEALKLVFALIKSMLETALIEGYDVILPYMVRNADEVANFENIARTHSADFHEFYLTAPDKEATIGRLLKRGTWGEAGQPPISPDEYPVIDELYDMVEQQLPKRPHMVRIQVDHERPNETYQAVMKHLASS